MALTSKQIKFCEEYLIDFHGTYAAIRCGVKSSNAAATASRWLKAVKIQQYIDDLRAKQSTKTGITLERVVQEIARVALFDARNMYNSNGQLMNPADMDADTRAAIAGVETIELPGGLGYTKKVKTVPKEKAQDMLMRYLGAYEKDNNQRQPNTTIIVDITDDDEQPTPADIDGSAEDTADGSEAETDIED